MGCEWLNRILEILRNGGIRAGESFPAGKRMDLEEPAAAVGIRDIIWKNGCVKFEVRILSPRKLGGWCCQNAAVEAVMALETAGVSCRMEAMGFQGNSDCFEIVVLATMQALGPEETTVGAQFRVAVNGVIVEGVTAFSAEQDRQRRLIGALNQAEPVGVTRGTGGWKIRMVQILGTGADAVGEPEEPFELELTESGLVSRFQGCCWNKVGKQVDQNGTRLEWEGFALSRTEAVDGQTEV